MQSLNKKLNEFSPEDANLHDQWDQPNESDKPNQIPADIGSMEGIDMKEIFADIQTILLQSMDGGGKNDAYQLGFYDKFENLW